MNPNTYSTGPYSSMSSRPGSYGEAHGHAVSARASLVALSGEISASQAATDGQPAHLPARPQAPANPLGFLDVSADTTTLVLVPDSCHLSARSAATDEDQTSFQLHYLVPSTRNSEQLGWIRDLVREELENIMLTEENARRILFYPRDGLGKNHRGTTLVRPPGWKSSTESGDTDEVTSSVDYDEWADTLAAKWEAKFAISRRGFGGKRFNAVTMDLHVTSKLAAGNSIDKYLAQGGAVFTATLMASQRWSRHAVSRPGRPRVEREVAHLAVIPNTTPAQGPSLSVPYVDSTLARTHAPVGVVVTHCSRCHSPATMEYHMKLSCQTRCTLDEHIDQRRAAVQLIRDKMIDSLLHLGPEPPVECLSRLLRETSTEYVHVALYSPQAAAEAVQTALDAGKRVIKGEIDLGMCASATTERDQGSCCLATS